METVFSDPNSLPSLKQRSFQRTQFYFQPSQTDAINLVAHRLQVLYC